MAQAEIRQTVPVASETAGRVAIAADAAHPKRLVISGWGADHCGGVGAGVHLSEDGGATWRTGCTLPGNADDERPLETPAVAFDNEGTLVVAQPFYWDADGGSLVVGRSHDGGQTWGDWHKVTRSHFERGTLSNATLAIDTSPTSRYPGRLYASYTDNSRKRVVIRVGWSDDGGRQWTVENASPVASGKELLDMSHLATGRDGSVYLSYLSCIGVMGTDCHGRPAELRVIRSANGGKSWSAPVVLAQTRLPPDRGNWQHPNYGGLPGTGTALSFSPVIAVDNSGGPHQNRLYAVMTTYAHQRLQVLLAASDDQGATWSAPQPVAAGPKLADQFMPWVSVNAEGLVAVTWLDQRAQPLEAGYQPMVAYSADGGASFSKPKALQKQISQPGALSTLSGVASHTWAGDRLKTGFIGTDEAGVTILQLSTSKP
ncbi:MAG TPA: sialidase family protein [Ideonella sp.]|uniref:sialidase family protein n=1 Tax=Ideonella sp. TaxID=1929293 RepID=UPI002E372A52|nr:sialidase family protein [Ideonella sp.]HEX5687947.1 sialidase family protein [Ideonella sp.]